jgi:NMD protein affecting ribosome stability and mRNA decay
MTFHVLCPQCGQRIEPLSHTETVQTPSRADTKLCRRCYQRVHSGVLPR